MALGRRRGSLLIGAIALVLMSTCVVTAPTGASVRHAHLTRNSVVNRSLRTRLTEEIRHREIGHLVRPHASIPTWYPDAPSAIDPSTGGVTDMSCLTTDGGATIWCVAVDQVGRALIGTEQASAGTNGTPGTMTWSAPVTLTPGSALVAVSCWAVGGCAAVSANGRSSVLTNTTWSTPSTFDASGSPQGLSCFGANACMAVDDQGDAFLFQGTWSSAERIDEGFTGGLTGVSCVPANSREATPTPFCLAIGLAGDIEAWSNGLWGIPYLVDANGLLDSVSCIGAPENSAGVFCSLADALGQLTAVCQLSSSCFSPYSTAPFGTDPGLNTVSCSDDVQSPATVLCAFIDSQGDLAYSPNGATFSVSEDSPYVADGAYPFVTPYFNTVSCVDNFLCVGFTDQGFSLTFDPAQPGLLNGSSAVVDVDNQLTQVVCTTNVWCLATDSAGWVFIGVDHVWTRQEHVTLAPGGFSIVMCPKTSQCLAVDTQGQGFELANAHWKGVGNYWKTTGSSCVLSTCILLMNNWSEPLEFENSSQLIAFSGGTFPGSTPSVTLQNIACGENFSCVVMAEDGTVYTTKDADLPNVVWHRATTVDAAGGPDAFGCVSGEISTCYIGDENGDIIELTATSTGYSASRPVALDSSGLQSVSCPTASQCVAVAGDGTIYVGSANYWTQEQANASGDTVNEVACAPFGTCEAVTSNSVYTLAKPVPAVSVHVTPAVIKKVSVVTVTVTGGPLATGSVKVMSTKTGCTTALHAGVGSSSGSCSMMFPTAGKVPLSATYSGDGTHAPATLVTSVVVAK